MPQNHSYCACFRITPTAHAPVSLLLTCMATCSTATTPTAHDAPTLLLRMLQRCDEASRPVSPSWDRRGQIRFDPGSALSLSPIWPADLGCSVNSSTEAERRALRGSRESRCWLAGVLVGRDRPIGWQCPVMVWWRRWNRGCSTSKMLLWLSMLLAGESALLLQLGSMQWGLCGGWSAGDSAAAASQRKPVFSSQEICKYKFLKWLHQGSKEY